MKRSENWLLTLFAARTAGHFCFCLFFILVFTMPATLSTRKLNLDLNGIVLCLFLLFTTYAGRWCYKQWVKKKEASRFFLNFGILLLLLSFAGAKGASMLFSQNRIPFVGFLSSSIPLVILFGLLGMFVTLTRSTLLQQTTEALIEKQQKQSELDLLISQLSPHFLFNTLNNLYGLSLTKQEKIPGLLLKLSDLLSYSVYDTKKTFVPLKDELAYIHNYIELEKIRFGDRLLLDADLDLYVEEGMNIGPLLLIVFLENAFKHAKGTTDNRIVIIVRLQIAGNRLVFMVKNSYGEENGLVRSINEHSGVGLSNTIKRMDLLYKGEYQLQQYAENNYYIINLDLPIK